MPTGQQAAGSLGDVTLFQTTKGTSERLAKRHLQFVADFTADAPVVDVSNMATDQEIVGFGGAFTEASAVVFKQLSPVLQVQVLERYFDPNLGLGYTVGRVPINSNDFSPAPGSWSEDDVPNDYSLANFDMGLAHDNEAMIPFITAALAKARVSGRQLKLFASPWSPPAWMKTNGHMVGGGKLRPECRAAWATYFVKWISAYKAHGIPIWAVTPQNEPRFAASWEACTYSAEEEADWLGLYLGPAMMTAHPEVKILPYDHNKDLVHQWAKAMYEHPLASRYTSGISFHWYSGDNFENLAKVHRDFPKSILLASEATWERYRWSPGTTVEQGDWSFGEGYAHDIIGDLNAGDRKSVV